MKASEDVFDRAGSNSSLVVMLIFLMSDALATVDYGGEEKKKIEIFRQI